MVIHSLHNPIQHVLFVITDALFGKNQEIKIIEILNFIQSNGTTIIGVGTGPVPYRIENIFTWSVWSKNPNNLRKALLELSQASITKNVFGSFCSIEIPINPKELAKLKNDTKNSEILEQFSNEPYISIDAYGKMNNIAFDASNFKDGFANDSNFDSFKDGAFKGYHVLVLMFYEGKPGTSDELITKEVFINGPKNMAEDIHSPGQKLQEKGFDYKICDKYKDAFIELNTGKYSIVMLCTASKGELNNTEDENYFEPFLDAVQQFHEYGGALILFGENPPFIFEINCILEKLPNINVRLDPNFRHTDPGGKIMEASQSEIVNPGEFLNCKYKFNANINGKDYKEFNFTGGGLKRLFEGRTLATFINEEEFEIFSITHNGSPSCIYRIPKETEGSIFIDSGSSKIFNEYSEEGAARYIINMVTGSIHLSNLGKYFYNNSNEKGIKVNVPALPRRSLRFKPLSEIYPPLIISIIIDATGSMFRTIKDCKNKIKELIEACKKKIKDVDIFMQFIAYRDLNNLSNMVEYKDITNNLDEILMFMSNTKATSGGWDGPENISVGFEVALTNINIFMKKYQKNCRNAFILIGDAPNQDPSIKKSKFKEGNQNKQPWDAVWKTIDHEMKEIFIDKLITIACKPDFEEQYKIWDNYDCKYIKSILKDNILKSYDTDKSFNDIFAELSERISSMYQNK